MELKVLVISHNVFSYTSSMGRTLANFFGEWKTENIAQLYLHTEIPTTDICTNYFRITDFDIIKKRKKDIGKVFSEIDIQKNSKTERVDKGAEAKIYSIGRKRKPYMYLGRNLLWASNKWKNKKLFNWIDDFNPDVIFFASGDYVFLYKVAEKIAKYKGIPILTYICDDYYFVNQKSLSPLYWIVRSHRRSAMKSFFAKHKNIISICDKIKEDYTKELGVIAHTIMTSSELLEFSKTDNVENCDDIIISYIGNLGYKRHLPLIEIGKALLKLYNGKVLLNVYSAENRPEVLKYLNIDNGIKFHGSIPYESVIKVMKKSDVLIHAENMDKEIQEKIRYSVSTKIADSLMIGSCLFAYGPANVASMQYLMENDCACVATDSTVLENKLKEIIENYDLRMKYGEKAKKIAKKNHDIKNNERYLSDIIFKIVDCSKID